MTASELPIGSGSVPHEAPLVSVVLPTHNRAHLVEQAVRSALDQSQRSLEVIVIDDASSDGTPELLSRLAAADPRLRVVRMERPSGAAGARNAGILEARGEWLAFLDDDDVWLPQKLDAQLKVAASDPGVGLVYSPYLHDGGSGVPEVRNVWDPATPPGPRRMLFRRFIAAVPTVLVRRDVVLDAGLFDTGLEMLEEWDFFIRIADRTGFGWVPEPLVIVRATPASLSSRADLFQRSAAKVLAKFETMPGVDRQDRAHAYYVVGQQLVERGVWRAGVRNVLRGLWMHPWRWQRYPMAFSALLGKRVQRRAIDLMFAIEARSRRRASALGRSGGDLA